MKLSQLLIGAGAFLSLAGQSHFASAYSQEGFSYQWKKVGRPTEARRIAACGLGEIYAMNWDNALYRNLSRGVDSGWTYVDTPWSAQEIACVGRYLYAMNYDKTLWKHDNSGWHYINTLGAAISIQSGGDWGSSTYSGIWAVNHDQSVWSSVDPVNGQWWPHGVAGSAKRVTAAHLPQTMEGGQTQTPTRAFALNYDGSLWYSPNPLTSSPSWIQLNTGGLSIIEISASSSAELFVLTSSYELWSTYFFEENFRDGIDNNQDGYVDRLP